MTDTISDLFVRINNARAAGKKDLRIPYSNFKRSVLDAFKSEGFVAGFSAEPEKRLIVVDINSPKPFVKIKRLSRPGRRLYIKSRDIPRPKSAKGAVFVSTPRGVLSGKEARKAGVGGELICEVY